MVSEAPESPRFLVISEDPVGAMYGMEPSDAQPFPLVNGPCPGSPQPQALTKEDWEKQQAELAKLDVVATATQAAGAQRGGRAQRALFSVGN